MCGRPLAFRRMTHLISHPGEAKPRLGAGQRKERSRNGGAFPHIGRQSRESRFCDADSNWAISAVLKIPPDIFARGPLPTRGLLTRFASVLESRHSTGIMSLSSVAV